VVPDKSERVYRFHQNTLQALKELVQAAGLQHPGEITASHIVRRAANSEVRLLSNLLPSVEPGALLAAMEGRVDWPHNVLPSCTGRRRERQLRGDAAGQPRASLSR
jgi:hypothetical protein